MSTHYSGGRASGQSVNRTGVSTPIANLGASIPGHPFHTSSYVNIYGEGPYHFYQQEPTYAIPPQVLSCDYTSQMPAMVSENVLCDHGGNQNMGAYSASAPAEQWYPQVSWRHAFRLTRSLKPYRRTKDRCFFLRAICNRHMSHHRCR